MRPLIWSVFEFSEIVVKLSHAKRLYEPGSYKLRIPRTMTGRDLLEMTAETAQLMWIAVQKGL
jgi:hypothetical protein